MSDMLREQVVQYLGQLTVIELADIITELEDTWNVSANAVVAQRIIDPTQPVIEQTEFDVIMTDFGSQKIKVIKAVRDLLGLGLKDAKAAIDNLPSTLIHGATQPRAQELSDALEAVGATITVQ